MRKRGKDSLRLCFRAFLLPRSRCVRSDPLSLLLIGVARQKAVNNRCANMCSPREDVWDTLPSHTHTTHPSSLCLCLSLRPLPAITIARTEPIKPNLPPYPPIPSPVRHFRSRLAWRARDAYVRRQPPRTHVRTTRTAHTRHAVRTKVRQATGSRRRIGEMSHRDSDPAEMTRMRETVR